MAYQLCPLWGKQKRLCPSSSSSWLLMPKPRGLWFTKGQHFILIDGKDDWFHFFFFEVYWWFVTSTLASAAFISAMCNVSFTTIFCTLYGIFTFFFLRSIEYWRFLEKKKRSDFVCACMSVKRLHCKSHLHTCRRQQRCVSIPSKSGR